MLSTSILIFFWRQQELVLGLYFKKQLKKLLAGGFYLLV